MPLSPCVGILPLPPLGFADDSLTLFSPRFFRAKSMETKPELIAFGVFISMLNQCSPCTLKPRSFVVVSHTIRHL